MPQNTTYIQAQNPWFGYPFGMTMEKRTVSEGKFGFNGKEKDTDFAEGVYDFGARLYDGRLGRFMGVDIYNKQYPLTTPYNFAANNPIAMIDKNGENPVIVVYLIYEGVTIAVAVVGSYYIIKSITDDIIIPLITTPRYVSYSPEYKHQQRQDKALEKFKNAREIAMININNNLPQGDDNDKYRKMADKASKGVIAGAVFMGALEILHNTKSVLIDQFEVQQNRMDEINKEITTLKQKEICSGKENAKISNLEKQKISVGIEMQAIQDALDYTNSQIKTEEALYKYNTTTRSDNTRVEKKYLQTQIKNNNE